MLIQATESLYYAILLVYKPKTHNLWKLRKKTKPYSQELFSEFCAGTDKHEEHLIDLLKRAYIEARYKPKDYLESVDKVWFPQISQMNADFFPLSARISVR